MNILMVTNTYKPILGGLEKSIEAFTQEYRRLGHRVMIAAPQFVGAPVEEDVIRIPALMHFKGTDFSLQLPVPGWLAQAMGDFKPDLVHTHHPFLAGDTALRVAYKFEVPLVFTHHSLYEQNVHYVSDKDSMKRFVAQLAVGYANLADAVFAPSESVEEMMRERGVETPIHIVPTGIDVERFSSGDGARVRASLGIPAGAFVVGHLGRLAPEKNLEFLARSVSRFMKKEPDSHFLVAGKGPSEEKLIELFLQEGLSERLHLAGPVSGKQLVDTYHAMDVFAFASQSETQGLVLAEAMAAQVPVVAVDASGVREVVKDGVNGRLIMREEYDDFAQALLWVARCGKKEEKLRMECLATAQEFSKEKSPRHALAVYESVIRSHQSVHHRAHDGQWAKVLRQLRADWRLVKNVTRATTGALLTA